MTPHRSPTPEPETAQFSVFEIWVGRVVAGSGLLLFVAGSGLFLLAGFTFGWGSWLGALTYGGIPLTGGLLVGGFLASRRLARATAAAWLGNFVYFWLIAHGALGL